MAHVYKKISDLLIDLSVMYSVKSPKWLADGLPYSMHRLAMDRAAYVAISDGSTYGYRIRHEPIAISETQKTKLEKRYGKVRKLLDDSLGDDLKIQAEKLFTVAKLLLLKDGYHVGVAFLISNSWITFVELKYPNRASKYVIIRELARLAKSIDANSVILIGEAWTAPADQLIKTQFASDAKIKSEILTLTAVNKEGVNFNISAKFHRRLFNKNKVRRVDEAVYSEPLENFIIFPFLREWGKLTADHLNNVSSGRSLISRDPSIDVIT